MIGLSAVKKLNAVIMCGLLGTVLPLSQPMRAEDNRANDSIKEQLTVTGSISCSEKVNRRFNCKRYDTLQSCTLSCVQAGGKFVVLVKEKPYLLKGADDTLKEFAGGKATVTGVATGNEIEVTSVGKAR